MFLIQLGHPKINTIPEQEFQSLAEFFLKLFKSPEESIYIFWNQIPLRFRYREDLFSSFNDMLALVWLLQKEEKGETKFQFHNQVMDIGFNCAWSHDELTIHAKFQPFEYLYEPYANTLNNSNSIQLSKAHFLNEWKTLFHQILVSLEDSKCTIEDGLERRRLELLQLTEKSIKGYGRLYTR